MRDKEKNITAEICTTRAALSTLDSKLSKLDQNRLKQQMIVSNQAREPCLCQQIVIIIQLTQTRRLLSRSWPMTRVSFFCLV